MARTLKRPWTGASAFSRAAGLRGSDSSPNRQKGTSGLYFRKELTGANGKYEAVAVEASGTTIDSGIQFVPPASETPACDADGNLVSDGHWTFTWDGENRLVSMTSVPQAASGSFPAVNGTRLTFSYDGVSRRIAKNVETQAPGSSTWTVIDRVGFVYDDWNIVMSARLNTANAVLGRIASYMWGPDVGSAWFAKADWQRAGGVGGLLMVLDGVSTPRSDGSNSPADPAEDNDFPCRACE